MAAPAIDPRVARIVAMFEAMAPADIAALGAYYTDEAFFRDPFNEVQGLASIQRVYAHMFDTLDGPRFVVHDIVGAGEQWFLTWDFVFRFKRSRAQQTVHGGSHLRLAADGRIARHRDYWDATDLYEKLPLLRGLMRWLKRRVNGS